MTRSVIEIAPYTYGTNKLIMAGEAVKYRDDRIISYIYYPLTRSFRFPFNFDILCINSDGKLEYLASVDDLKSNAAITLVNEVEVRNLVWFVVGVYSSEVLAASDMSAVESILRARNQARASGCLMH